MSRWIHSSWGSYRTNLQRPMPIVRYFDGEKWSDGQIEERNGSLAWVRDIHTEQASWRDRWEPET